MNLSFLKKCPLFTNLSDVEIEKIISDLRCTTRNYSKSETIALEGDSITSLGIVMEGSIEVQKLLPSGKLLTISKIFEGGIFGEVIVFSKLKQYPSTITASSDSNILFIPKEYILELCSSNSTFLKSFMGLLSNKLLMLNNKITLLSCKTIRQKISMYLINEYNKQNSLTINLSMSRKEMADSIGVPRPSLSREFANMKDDGILDFYRNSVKILDLYKLEETLIE